MMLMDGRLSKFVGEIIETIIEENNEKTMWEFWLHKDWERSWSEFRASLNDNKYHAAPTYEKLEKAVSDSANMLKNFCPDSEVQAGEYISSVRGNSD